MRLKNTNKKKNKIKPKLEKIVSSSESLTVKSCLFLFHFDGSAMKPPTSSLNLQIDTLLNPPALWLDTILIFGNQIRKWPTDWNSINAPLDCYVF
uniref:Uncharacterized protein n=1 Tax=Nelumbo nucifera TaxID=4432 RepID=A0A822Y8K0_NELNU|nr:TPA_asm: hypothetical protein HUJ06_009235 [Nelumbo nucifera]